MARRAGFDEVKDMSPITVVVGTFLIWILAKGEMQAYMKLATTKATAKAPASGTGGGVVSPTVTAPSPSPIPIQTEPNGPGLSTGDIMTMLVG
jgi:hypothetical protein